MAADLKDTLTKQASEKREKKDIERANDIYKPTFPFESEAVAFKITPKNPNMYGTVINFKDINLFKELPLMYDI